MAGQAPLDPLLRLPYDVWVHCLRFAAYATHSGPLSFLGVSKLWEYHIIEAPELWTHIEIGDSEDLLARIETFLWLSKSKLLDITIKLPLSGITRSGFKAVLDSSHRLRSVFFDVDDRHLIHFVPSPYSSARSSFSTSYPSSYPSSSLRSAPDEMLDAVLHDLNVGDRAFPELKVIATTDELSTTTTQPRSYPPTLSKRCPKLSVAPLFDIPAEDIAYLSPDAQSASFILKDSDDISNIFTRYELRSISVVDLDQATQSSRISETVLSKPLSGVATSSMLQIISLTTNQFSTISSFFDIRHPFLHTLTLELPMFLGRSFLGLLPLLPSLKHLSFLFSNYLQPVHRDLSSSFEDDPFCQPSNAPFSASSTASTNPLQLSETAPCLESLSITDRQLFSDSQHLSAILDSIATSNSLNVAKIIEIKTFESIPLDPLLQLLQSAPGAEDLNIEHGIANSFDSSHEAFPELPRSGFVTPKRPLQQKPQTAPALRSIRMRNLRTLGSNNLGTLPFISSSTLERLICPNLREYGLQSFPSHLGATLKEIHIDPKGFEAIDSAMARGRNSHGSDDDELVSGSVWSSLSRLIWSPWAYRPSLPVTNFLSLTYIEFPTRLFVGFDLQTCISPVNYFLAEMLRYPESCPSLSHIATREYPHWDLLFDVMYQRNNTESLANISSIDVPSLPILPILQNLVALLKGRKTLVSTGITYQIISERHENEQNICCLQCIEAGYITCLDATTMNHGASPGAPISSSMALSLESAGFNELNELFEFEICDSLVRAANSPEIGWMEWERRLQDCGRSEAVLAHSNGNGRPTCTRHNPIRLSIVNGGTLDGTGEELEDFDEDDESSRKVTSDKVEENGCLPRNGTRMNKGSLLLLSRVLSEAARAPVPDLDM